MSWLAISLDAYDVMDRVHIIVRVRSTTEDREECIEPVLHCATTILSTGETDPRQWAIDALVGALEAL
jgi:hypothetical protein